MFCICHNNDGKSPRGFSKRDTRLDFHLEKITLVICSVGDELKGGQGREQPTIAMVQAEGTAASVQLAKEGVEMNGSVQDTCVAKPKTLLRNWLLGLRERLVIKNDSGVPGLCNWLARNDIFRGRDP